MRNTKQAFTLIELLVVIAIVSIISATIITSLDSARSKARDAQRMSHIREIQQALEMYHIDNGQYPIGGWFRSYSANWEGIFGVALEPYMPALPVDPINENLSGYSGGLSYAYYSEDFGGSGDWYGIAFTLENQNLALDLIDGVYACDSTFFNFGGDDGYIIIKGGDCLQ